MLQNVQLYYLIQIDHYQSLSQAAEELHVSQPAISNAIKRLETQLGVKLSVRWKQKEETESNTLTWRWIKVTLVVSFGDII